MSIIRVRPSHFFIGLALVAILRSIPDPETALVTEVSGVVFLLESVFVLFTWVILTCH